MMVDFFRDGEGVLPSGEKDAAAGSWCGVTVFVLFEGGPNCMEDPFGCCHIGGTVSKGEVVFCHHSGMGILGTGVI